jgi:hypothetical protein
MIDSAFRTQLVRTGLAAIRPACFITHAWEGLDDVARARVAAAHTYAHRAAEVSALLEGRMASA